jgi:predicted permease
MRVKRDLSLALKNLRRNAAFALAAILILGLGTASVTSVASIAYTVVAAPLPVRDASSVVVLGIVNPTKQPPHFPLSGGEYLAFARESRTLSAVAAMDYRRTLPRLITVGDTVVSIPAALVTGNFFDVVGARPLLGRLLRPADDGYGAPFVGVISEHLWRTLYNADPHVVGTTTKFYLHQITIVGVVAGVLDFPRGAELWGSFPNYVGAKDTLPGFYDVIGRLAPGNTASSAQNEFQAFLMRKSEPHSAARLLVGQDVRATATPLLDELVGNVRPAFAVVMAAVSLLLVVTCVNVAGLMLGRGVARRREFAVRAALGAGWHRIASQTVAESAILCAFGGAIGVGASWFAVRLFAAFPPATLPRAQNISLSLPALLGAVGFCVVATIVLGLAQAVIAMPRSLSEALADRRDTGGNPRAQRLRQTLISVQVALAITVLAFATVIARRLDHFAHQDLGFEPNNLLIARLGQHEAVGGINESRASAERILARVREVPGVTHASGMLFTPFREDGLDLAYSLPSDGPSAPTNRPMADWIGVDFDYFKALGIPLLQGRAVTASDRDGSARVAVVDEMLAREAWPGADPLGKQIGVGTTYYTVVGAVASTRYRDILSPRATLYTPMVQSPDMSPQYVAIRTSTAPNATIPGLRAAVREADARVYLADFATMNTRIGSSLSTSRVIVAVLGAFAVAMLALTGVGLYSVASTFVRQREAEIGIRMALGATPARVTLMIMAQGTRVVVAGAVFGLSLVLISGRALESVVYSANARDPVALAVATAIVVAVAAVALASPLRRALRTSPADALRVP